MIICSLCVWMNWRRNRNPIGNFRMEIITLFILTLGVSSCASFNVISWMFFVKKLNFCFPFYRLSMLNHVKPHEWTQWIIGLYIFFVLLTKSLALSSIDDKIKTIRAVDFAESEWEVLILLVFKRFQLIYDANIWIITPMKTNLMKKRKPWTSTYPFILSNSYNLPWKIL